ncbi:ABC transporter ATP-binding protein [Inquilinus sp. CAU 1745]|uniref:ABC transporter ATP-binding protein n=1 Tax=Inquilinus sp. CAU 1745 TaxID=3140369 RepID=UPI00325AC299
MSEPILTLKDITRQFDEAGHKLDVLRGASLSIEPGELVALVGPSGSGKSTLLHIAGLLERATGGEITVDGTRCDTLGDRERTALRRTAIGFVYQFHHLLPEFSAQENIILPQMIDGVSRSKAKERARDLLAKVGLADRATHRPGQLSGGEQQRVAIARALANQPRILLADEPTGNLDEHTAEDVFALLKGLVHETGTGALIATHNLDLADQMDRVLEMRDGHLTALRKAA